MVRSRVQEAEIARRAVEGRDYALTEEEITTAISAYAKQRRDSIQSYQECGREDLAKKEAAELAILQGYLPEQLDPEAIRKLVREAIQEARASSPRDMGKVMQLVMPRVRGAADGKAVNQIVKELLSGGK